MDIRVFNVLSIKFINEAGIEFKDQKNITRDALFKLTFNTDIDRGSIKGQVVVINNTSKENVAGNLTFYDTRSLVFKPAIPYHSGVEYSISITKSTNNPLKSVLGIACTPYSYAFNVKTEALINAPALIAPHDQSMLSAETSKDTLIIRYKPISEVYYGPHVEVPTQQDLTDAMNKELHVKFSWKSSINAKGYKVELSTSEHFDILLWSRTINVQEGDVINGGIPVGYDVDTERVISTISDVALLESTLYYWRVKAFTFDITTGATVNGQPAPSYGAYSGVWKFTILKELSPSIVNVDDPNIDLATQDDSSFLVVESIFPEYEYSNVSVNLKSLYITIDGLISDPKSFKPHLWLIEGRHVTEDVLLQTYDVDTTTFSNTTKMHHGKVNGTWIVAVDETNMKTVIIFQPVKL